MKRLFLIRHAKSSWTNENLDDFDRPLNKRGKRDAPEMAGRLCSLAVKPDLIVSSPAKRARKTALKMAAGTGYDKKAIRFYDGLYAGELSFYISLLQTNFQQFDTIFVVGHNYTITELAEYLSASLLDNIPTCGIVAIEYSGKGGFTPKAGAGRLLFFDFPKNRG